MSLTALARAKQAKGDSHGASAAIRKAERLASRLDRINVNYIFAAAHRARLDLLQGNIDAANAWAEERKMEAISEPASPYSLHELEALTLARIRIAQHQPEEALDLVKPLLDGAMEFHRGGSRIETLVVQALAHESQGNMDDALTSLLMALELAEPEGYVRVFADEGQPMARLLYEASSRRIMPQYVGKLLAALSTPASPAAFQWRQDSTAEPLRDREKEVLSLIAEGLSNKEIAARLHVAVRTVKWHTGNIYGKLGVKTRTQAVARARLLGIILS